MKRCISFDIGHGESASAYPTEIMRDGKTDYDVKRLAFDKSRVTVYSRIFISEEQMKELCGMKQITYEKISKLGSFIIGDFSKQTKTPGQTFSYFKVQPSKFDDVIKEGEYAEKYNITHRMVMSCFIHQAVKEILSSNPNDIEGCNNLNTTLLVGCPTSKEWTAPANRDAYKKLIMNATGFKDIEIIPESRAAMFSSITYNKKSIAADKGAIIFDFGSSTADCTYMWMGKKIEEFSWRLGASEIEMALWNYFVAKYNTENPDKKITTQQNIISSDEGIKLLRKCKEEFFDTQNDIDVSLIIEKTEELPKIPLLATVDDESIDEVLHNYPLVFFKDDKQNTSSDSWYCLCKRFFEYAKDKITSMTVDGEPCPITSIALTGGASKMPFVKELCKQVFPKATIYLEDIPSYSVSNGLCWSQIIDNKAVSVLNDILEKVKEVPECKVDSLLRMMADGLVDPLLEIIGDKAKEWSESEADSSIEELIKAVSDYIEKPNVKNQLKKVISEQEAAWKKQCSNTIYAAVKEKSKKLFSKNVPDYIANYSDDAFTQIHLNFEEVINSICSDLVKYIQNTIISIVIFIIGLVIWYTGYGIIIGGPLMYYAEDIADKIPLVRREISKPRRQRFRKKVADNINSNKKDAMSEKIYKSIKADFENSKVVDDEKIQANMKQIVENAVDVISLKKFEE